VASAGRRTVPALDAHMAPAAVIPGAAELARSRGRGVLCAGTVEEALFADGCEFDFFQAVRLLARIFAKRRPVGSTARPNEEFVRFGQLAGCPDVREARLAMAFPASAVHAIERASESGGPAQMRVAFFGLTGTQGILPLCYTEWMMARRAAKDDTLAAFFDLFNHRLISLFYRAWEKHHPPVLYELAAARDQRPDPFTQYLFDLIGMGTRGLRGRLRVADESLLRYAGLVAQRPLAAPSLRGILRDYFAVPVEIDQCVGDWYVLEESDRCYLAPESSRNQLGAAAFLGAEIWNQQSLFRIRIGPLGLDRFLEFLPDGWAMAKLTQLTTYLVGQAMAFDVQVLLRADDVPYARLSDEGNDAPRLGWIGWLKTGDFDEAAGDAVFRWVN
jgi:type VI secretion system protein ImpH